MCHGNLPNILPFLQGRVGLGCWSHLQEGTVHFEPKPIRERQNSLQTAWLGRQYHVNTRVRDYGRFGKHIKLDQKYFTCDSTGYK